VSLTVPYRKFPDPSGAGGIAYYAVIPVSIALPAQNSPRSKRFEGIIDSGATNCIFHADIGKAIGLDVAKGDPLRILGVAGPTSAYMHDVSLYAPGGIIAIRAGFSADLPIAGLLGMKGFFDHFKVTFDPTALACTLERIYKA
jgi:hypothetical protein